MAAPAGSANKVYRYGPEIKQMMFVFGEVKDPDDVTVRYVEDIVRGQVAELVIQARALALRRNSRTLSTEDLIFLIRHDRAKVTRLRTYLGWKDVRKRAKDTEGGGNDAAEIDEIGAADEAAVAAGGPGGPTVSSGPVVGVGVNPPGVAPGPNTSINSATATAGGPNNASVNLAGGPKVLGASVAANNPSGTAIAPSASAAGSGQSSQRMRIKIPWDITTIYSEFIPENSDDEDEDEKQAYEDSKRRLKAADDLTKAMTREEYTQYSEARQASFTYRKGKRFRDFINFASFMEGNPNDEVIDVLGFLSYEMVRTLCEKGFEVQAKRMQRELKAHQDQERRKQERLERKRKRREKRQRIQNNGSSNSTSATKSTANGNNGKNNNDSNNNDTLTTSKSTSKSQSKSATTPAMSLRSSKRRKANNTSDETNNEKTEDDGDHDQDSTKKEETTESTNMDIDNDNDDKGKDKDKDKDNGKQDEAESDKEKTDTHTDENKKTQELDNDLGDKNNDDDLNLSQDDDDSSDEDDEEGQIPTGPFSAPEINQNDLYSSVMASQRRLQQSTSSNLDKSENAQQDEKTEKEEKVDKEKDNENEVSSDKNDDKNNKSNVENDNDEDNNNNNGDNNDNNDAQQANSSQQNGASGNMELARQPLSVRDIDQAFEELLHASANRLRTMRCFTGGPLRTKFGLL